MSREILFKAKHIHVLKENEYFDRRWIEGYLCDKNYIYSPELEGQFLIDENTICQYTGLTDKNGRKIFEGDIFHIGDKKIPYFVEWHDTGFMGKALRANDRIGLLHWNDKIEIMGNIADNPELLEGGTK